MNARKLSDFLQSKTGMLTLFGILFILGLSLIYGFNKSRKEATAKIETTTITAKKMVEETETSYDIPHFLPKPQDGVKPPESPKIAGSNLSILVYNNPKAEIEISDNYLPFGTIVPCILINTIDSSRINTPIIGMVTMDMYSPNGRKIISAGTLVHGGAQLDRVRNVIATKEKWVLVTQRDGVDPGGEEQTIQGIGLTRIYFEDTKTWGITDMAAGLRGDVIKVDNLAELKLFAATFLSAAASSMEHTQGNAYGTTTVESTPQNAALAGTAAVINGYAQEMLDAIKRDGVFVRVTAGKEFYLYITQTFDRDLSRRGETLNSQVKDPSVSVNSPIQNSTSGMKK